MDSNYKPSIDMRQKRIPAVLLMEGVHLNKQTWPLNPHAFMVDNNHHTTIFLDLGRLLLLTTDLSLCALYVALETLLSPRV